MIRIPFPFYNYCRQFFTYTGQMMSSRELAEIRHASKSRLMEEEIKKRACEQERKSLVRKRQIDRNIYLATQLNDIQTPTPSPRRKGSCPPHITISFSDHHHHHSSHNTSTNPNIINNNSDCDSDSDTNLVHLRARTRRNTLLSQQLSRSLEVMGERRAQSPRPPPSASGEGGAYRPVSCRSVEDLQRAAAVLRFTKHEEEVQQLLNNVTVSRPCQT